MLGFTGEKIPREKGCDGNPESDWCCSMGGGFWRGQQLGNSSLVPWAGLQRGSGGRKRPRNTTSKKDFLIKEAKENCKMAETKACKKDEVVYSRVWAGK